MPDIIEGPPREGDPSPPLLTRLKWFILLALGGLVATAGLAYALRALLGL